MAVSGADEGVRVFASTNQTTWGAVFVYEAFLRDGQTNLIRNTVTSTQEGTNRFHRFYHGGQYLGSYVFGTNSSGCTTQPGCPYMLSFVYGPSNELRSVIVGDSEGHVVDVFGCTNGIISPAPVSLIRESKRIDVKMSNHIHPDGIRREVWGE